MATTSARSRPRREAQRISIALRGAARVHKSLYLPKIKRLVIDLKSPRRCSAQAVRQQLDFAKDEYLPFLEFGAARQMTNKFANYAKVKEALTLLRNPENRLPTAIAKKADELYKKFAGAAWDASTPTPAPRAKFTGEYPPEDHPIWGKEGIMHGVVLGHGPHGNPTYRLDDRYDPRNAEVYGHNGLQPGMWFPRQECLRFHGGHAQKIRGISGHENKGAYSIVVSGAYDDIDKDEGDIIYYSAEGAHGRDASRRAEVKGNRALRASIRSHNPVRVFRSAKGPGRFAPPCGIRYDGLYEVFGREENLNAQGESYDLYKLRRLVGIDQPDLKDIVRARPTPQEQAHYERIKAGY